MTMVLLVRHAHHDLLGRELVGRRPGVRLSAQGRRQAALLGAALAETPLARVLSSPRERTLETAAAIAEAQGCEVEVAPSLDEVDFGDWNGRAFAELEGDPEWRRFNAMRSRAAIPGGERMLDVEARAVALIEDLARRFPGERLALVTHGDVIRASLLHYLGMALDLIHRLHVAPASVSVLSLRDSGARVLAINGAVEPPPWAEADI